MTNISLFSPVARGAALCLVSLLFVGQPLSAEALPTAASHPVQNVVIVLLDTLGAKHLGCYAKGVSDSPRIDALARSGVRFEHATAPAPWTKPSIAAVLTGGYPSDHGVIGYNDALAPDEHSIAEVYQKNGFATLGVVSNIFLNERSGFDQGFDQYSLVGPDTDRHDAITSPLVTDAVLNWLDTSVVGPTAAEKKRFFVFAHYYDPHYNYQHHKEFDQTSRYRGALTPGLPIAKLRERIPSLKPDDVQYLVGLHHEEIAFTDFHVGRLLDGLKSRGLADNTLIVFTADHGEEFMEHGYLGHARTLYEELVHVPLIMALPGRIPAAVVSANVSLVDIAPTLMTLTGIQGEGLYERGTSLAATLTDGMPVESDRLLFSEVDFRSSVNQANMLAVRKGKVKLVVDKATEKSLVFDLAVDSKEQKALAENKPEVVTELELALSSYRHSVQAQVKEHGKSRSSLHQTPKEVEQLKSLGYL